MHFRDRLDAARQLADALRRFEGANPLVLAIPRGAVPMGKVIAERLRGELDVVLVHKLCSPMDPEYAVGAIDESGWTYIPDEIRDTGIALSYLESEAARELELLRARRAAYTPGRAAADAKGRVAIVVDDGLATGATMVAALHSVRGRGPARLVCAVPVASLHGLNQARALADEVVCLSAPVDFHAVSQFYASFQQVDDTEVVALLRAGERARAAALEKGIA